MKLQNTQALFQGHFAPRRAIKTATAKARHLKFHRKIPDADNQTEIMEVNELNNWNQKKVTSEYIQNIERARDSYKHQQEYSDSVLTKIFDQKAKKAIPTLRNSSSQGSLPIINEITLMRLLAKNQQNRNLALQFYAKEYEKELQNSYFELSQQMQELNNQRDTIRSEICQLREDIRNLDEKYAVWVRQFEEKQRKEQFQAKVLGTIEISDYIYRKTVQRINKQNQDTEHDKMIKMLNQQIQDKSQQVQQLDIKASKVRKLVNLVLNAKITHFTNLLQEGLDTRGEGLSWIIKRLRNLGVTVTESNFPLFLEKDTIQVIYKLTKKNDELEILIEKLQMLTNNDKDLSNQKQGQMWKKVIKERLHKLSYNLTLRKQEKHFDKKQKVTITSWRPFYPERRGAVFNITRSNGIVHAADVQQQIHELKEEVFELQKKEIIRITHDTYLNLYKAPQKCSIDMIVSTLVGYENIDRFMTLIAKEQRTLAEELAKITTFKFSDKS